MSVILVEVGRLLMLSFGCDDDALLPHRAGSDLRPAHFGADGWILGPSLSIPLSAFRIGDELPLLRQRRRDPGRFSPGRGRVGFRTAGAARGHANLRR